MVVGNFQCPPLTPLTLPHSFPNFELFFPITPSPHHPITPSPHLPTAPNPHSLGGVGAGEFPITPPPLRVPK
ncbi:MULTISPECIES: hypothetical protein [Fischerella]|uniref:hypothetical protein n=1 Tax=Fischerella TaxID=1190 RepID=UPI0002E7E821|nr:MULTISPECIES: hypothetical protein [Fischerella]MBD2430194.1 hypothetical protein [Fischerella sp. FACHB-380]